MLNNKNFKDIKKIEKFDDAVPGTVLEQNYHPGAEVVPEETILEFTVSQGPELIKVKDLTGYTAADVQDYAGGVGLNAEVSQEDYHDTIAKGEVISQEPKAGENVEKGSTITVIISKGAEELPPKQEQ